MNGFKVSFGDALRYKATTVRRIKKTPKLMIDDLVAFDHLGRVFTGIVDHTDYVGPSDPMTYHWKSASGMMVVTVGVPSDAVKVQA